MMTRILSILILLVFSMPVLALESTSACYKFYFTKLEVPPLSPDGIWHMREIGSTRVANLAEREMEKYLEIAPFKIVEYLRTSSKGWIVEFDNGIRAVVKRHNPENFTTNIDSEIAAYKLSRLWKFDVVSTTVERTIKGERYSFQVIVNDASNSVMNRRSTVLYRDKSRVFNYLIYNFDQQLLHLPTRSFSTDHGAAFYFPQNKSWNVKKISQLSLPTILDLIENIDMQATRDVLKGLVLPERIEDIQFRKDESMRFYLSTGDFNLFDE